MNIENSNTMIFDSFSVKICIYLGASKWKWKIIILGVEIVNKLGAKSLIFELGANL